MSDAASKPAPSAAQKATQKGALTKGGTIILGIFGPKDALKAMIREPFRGTRVVKVGDRTALGPVRGIDTKGIVVDQNGEARRLAFAE